MLSCAEFLTEFGEYLEESADLQLRLRLETHLHECKTCQVILDSTRKTIRFVTENDSFTLPDNAFEPIVGAHTDQHHVLAARRLRGNVLNAENLADNLADLHGLDRHVRPTPFVLSSRRPVVRAGA